MLNQKRIMPNGVTITINLDKNVIEDILNGNEDLLLEVSKLASQYQVQSVSFNYTGVKVLDSEKAHVLIRECALKNKLVNKTELL